MDKNKEPILTCEETAEYLKIPLSTVWYLIRQKKIPAAKIGKHYRIKREDIEKLLKTEGEGE